MYFITRKERAVNQRKRAIRKKRPDRLSCPVAIDARRGLMPELIKDEGREIR